MCIIDEEKYASISFIAENINNMAVMITDKNGNIEYVNNYFEILYGFNKEEVKGKKPSILKSGLHTKEFYEEMWNTILQGKIYENKVINKRKDGETIHTISSIYPLLNIDKNKVLGFITIYRDITYYSYIESKYKMILEVIGDLKIIILNSKGGVIETYPNNSGEELFYEIIRDSINLETHVNILNLIDREEIKNTYKTEYIIDVNGEVKVYIASYSRFNLNKYIIVLNEITDAKIERLKKIYTQNIEKLKTILSEYND